MRNSSYYSVTGEITIPILYSEVVSSKESIFLFDSQKTYNKFPCNSNYKGYLGELVLHRYLTEQGIQHTWLPFIKDSWDECDFIINGSNIDLKTTTTDCLWFQTPKHPYYLGAYINPNDTYMILKGIISNDKMMGKALGVQHHNTKCNKIEHYKLNSISEAIKQWERQKQFILKPEKKQFILHI